MSETKFTPGPWHSGGHEFVDPHSDQANGGYSICEVCGPDLEANARLIAAAPEMYAALKAALGYLEDANIWGGLPDAMREALAKAEGKTT